MLIDILAGTVGVVGIASGVSALIFYRKQNGNGHAKNPWRYEPPLAPQPQTVLVPELAALPERLQQGLAPVFEDLFERLENPLRSMSEMPPEWVAAVIEGLGEGFDDIRSRLASEPLWPGELIRGVKNLSEQMEAMRPSPQPDLEPRLAELSEKLEKVAHSLPSRIGQTVGELLTAERARNPKSPPPAKNEGHGNPPPPRSAPPNLPRMSPGDMPGTPSIPAPYVPGSVYVPAGEVWSLLLLIQKQLSPNCPGSSVEFALSADDEILVGGASQIGGALSATNYAYKLTADSPPRIYRSTYPGGNTPVGSLQVLAPAGGYLHVEVQS